MKSNKSKFIWPTFLAVSLSATFGATLISCTHEDPVGIKAASYADALGKVATGDATVAGGWFDSRFYAGKEAENIAVIGVSNSISNDGIQANKNIKKGDVTAIQKLFIDTIKQAKADAKAKKESNLTYKAGEKIKDIFAIYNHDGYSKVAEDAEIVYDINGSKQKAYSNKLAEGSDYFDITSENKVVMKAGAKPFRIIVIPSSDPKLISEAAEKLQKYFHEQGLTNIEVSVGTDYNTAAQSLASNAYQLGFFPVKTWQEYTDGSSFILQAGRDVQIVDPYESKEKSYAPKFNDEKLLIEAANHYKEFNNSSLYINSDPTKNPNAVVEGYSAELKAAIDEIAKDNTELPKVGYYRAYIFARKDSELYKIVNDALKAQGSNWVLEWKDVKKHVKYVYTSTTSASSFQYPEAWFKKHFKGFESFLK